jgi:hypothetical protein
MAKQSGNTPRRQHEKLEEIRGLKAKSSLSLFMRGGAIYAVSFPKGKAWL